MTCSSEAYRREAQHLFELAAALPFGLVRNEFVGIASQYEALARHAESMERRTATDLPDATPPMPSIRRVTER